MSSLRKKIPLALGALLVATGAYAETYTISSSPPSATTVRLDTDGNFTVSVPSGLWTQTGSTITRRYGTVNSRRLLPSGSVQSIAYAVSPNSTLNITNRLRGTTEFLNIRHCYEYSNNPATAQCFTTTTYLTVQSFPSQTNFTTTLGTPPEAGDDFVGGE